jgi:hypothetical protein
MQKMIKQVIKAEETALLPMTEANQYGIYIGINSPKRSLRLLSKEDNSSQWGWKSLENCSSWGIEADGTFQEALEQGYKLYKGQVYYFETITDFAIWLAKHMGIQSYQLS